MNTKKLSCLLTSYLPVILFFVCALVPAALFLSEHCAHAETKTASINAGVNPQAIAVNPATNTVFAANSGSGTVTVMNGQNNSIATITVGSFPAAIAINPVTNLIYVANNGDGTVTVIDGANPDTGHTSTVTVGTGPSAIAVNSVTNKIYVVNTGDNSVTVINGANNTTAKVSVGNIPRAIAVNQVTNKIYVANSVSNGSITIIDGVKNSTTTVLLPSGSGSFPSAIAVNPVTNQIYIANSRDDASYKESWIVILDGKANTLTSVPIPIGHCPIALTVNPVTNKVYVANSVQDSVTQSFSVTMIDGTAKNATTTISTGSSDPYSIAVNPVTNKIYSINFASSDMIAIDGSTNNPTSVPLPGTINPCAVAINPVTNRIYTADSGSNTISVIDGEANAVTVVSTGNSPSAIASNPVTNMVYSANTASNNVTVIDSGTGTPTTVPAGTQPSAVAVNTMTNKIYVANSGSGDVTVIDGTSNIPVQISTGGTDPYAIAVNPAVDLIYVANYLSGEVSVIDGSTNAVSTVAVGSNPCAIDINQTTGMAYVVNGADNTVTVLGGGNVQGTVSVGASPAAVAVNPATNKIYVANSGDGTVTRIDASAGNVTKSIPVGTIAATGVPWAVSVNPVTNMIYVANYHDGTVSVIDGSSDTEIKRITVGSGPLDIKVNSVTNRIYVVNNNTNDVTVIDGASNAATTLYIGSAPSAVALNTVTDKISIANKGGNNVAIMTGAALQNIPLTVSITPLLGNLSLVPNPVFSYTTTSSYTPTAPPVKTVYYQVDTCLGAWNQSVPVAGKGSTTGQFTIANQPGGLHTVFVFAGDGQEATSINAGSGISPIIGKMTAYSFLTPTVPDAPGNVTAKGGNAQATVSFTVPDSDGGSPITSYTVSSGNISAVGTSSPIRVTGLTNGTVYTFKVAATNIMGTGPSGISNSVLPNKTPPDAPSLVTATVKNPTSVLVSFEIPNNGGDPITSYTATAIPGPATGTSNTGSPILVSGLSTGTIYVFTVTATNAQGTSAPSSPSNPVTPADKPGVPTGVTAVAGDTKATVSFTAPAANGTPITSYTVTACDNGGTPVVPTITATGAASPIVVTGLTDGTTYTFKVAATNAIGTGNLSLVSNSVIPSGVPGAPIIGPATGGNSQAIVNFSPPASNGGSAITLYTATSSPGGITGTSATSPITVNGLANGSTYTFTVTATNAQGTGPASVASNSVTPATLPGAPTGVAATATGSTQATVSFAAAAANGSPITSYTVTACDAAGTPVVPAITATGAASPITVTGLTLNSNYTFTVVATNAVGTGPASALSNLVRPSTTAPGAPTGVTATVVAGNGIVSVSFTPPSSNGGSAISGYIVTACDSGGTPVVPAVTANGAASPIVVNSGLTNGTPYTFRVTAQNGNPNPDGNLSPFSNASPVVTPADKPGAPGLGVASATPGPLQITVNFGASAPNGSPVTLYTVTSTPGNFVATGTTTSVTVTGLAANVPYTFMVTATNAMGTSGAAGPIGPATPQDVVPGSPTGVQAVAGNAQATVSFTGPVPNGGSAVTSYTVTSNPGGIIATGSASPITVTGLTNGTPYTFTVTATNSKGTGPASSTSNMVIPATTPGVPTAVSATAGIAQATVSFTAPASNGGSAITSYVVTSSPGGIKGTGATSPITVNGLANGTSYTFTVAAVNGVGMGFASVPSNSVTPGAAVPGSPTGVWATAGNAQAVVTFTPPYSNGGSPISLYTVTSSPGGIKGTGTASPITVTGLANGTAYTFTVVAANAVGTGLPSINSNSVVPLPVPGSPTAVSASAGNGQALVSFKAPALTGSGPITSYVVTSSPGSRTATGKSSPIKVTGLTNGTAYSFTVKAVNKVGKSPASIPSNVIKPASAPGAPSGVKATAGNGQATVSFVPPVSNGGETITQYTVTSNPGGKTATGASSPITVTGLTNGTSYTFTVKATNKMGTGPFSMKSNAVTPSSPSAVPGAPTGVSAVAGNAQATVKFTAPSNAGSPITSYTVESSPGNIIQTGKSSPITVKGLTNGTAYTFTVKATNAAGTGPASSKSNSVTPATKPGSPTGVRVSSGNGQATVSFTPPASNGGSPITYYKVISSPGNISQTGKASPITLMRLKNGTSYTFTVTATNRLGTSPASEASGSIVPR